MRRIIILLVPGLFLAFLAAGQVRYISPTAHSWGFGLGAGIAVLQGDVDNIRLTPAGRANLEYNITPYVSLGLEAQAGKLEAGKVKTKRLYTRVSFTAANINARVSSGQFFRNRINPGSVWGGLYFGLGVGIVQSSVSKIGTQFTNGKDIPGIVKSASSVAIPINLGINVELGRFIGLNNMVANINYQYNFVQGEKLDGYAYNAGSNESNDGYSFLSVGLKYNFGRLSGR